MPRKHMPRKHMPSLLLDRLFVRLCHDRNSGISNPATPAKPPFDVAQAAVVLMAIFAGGCVFLTGLLLRETTLSVAGGAAFAMSVLLLCREMLQPRRPQQ